MVYFDKEQQAVMALHTELTILATHAHAIMESLESAEERSVAIPSGLLEAAASFVDELRKVVGVHSESYKKIKE
ncbi:hypothetical protein KASIA_p121 [Shewanella phage vB_SspS_KASIA]|nr:hypothetical protein KASIA_p121 [Shewanella phage vB_SspS_KASIA]